MLDFPHFVCSEVSPVALPSQGQLFPDSGRATVSGWGTLRSGGALPDLLHAVEVPLVSDASCEDSYGNRMSAKEMLCAGEAGKDSCQGDSGGPLMTEIEGRWTLIGIVSAGYSCAKRGQPGIYHRVSHTSDWVSYSVNN